MGFNMIIFMYFNHTIRMGFNHIIFRRENYTLHTTILVYSLLS